MINSRAGTRAVALGMAIVATAIGGGCRIERVSSDRLADTRLAPFDEQAAQLLAAQANAWNAGDLEEYLSFYDQSPATTYVLGGELVSGFDGIRSRYAPVFSAETRDSLRMECLDCRILDGRAGLIRGRYELHRDGLVSSGGVFTLVVLNVEGAWRIAHEHSSSAPTPSSESP